MFVVYLLSLFECWPYYFVFQWQLLSTDDVIAFEYFKGFGNDVLSSLFVIIRDLREMYCHLVSFVMEL